MGQQAGAKSCHVAGAPSEGEALSTHHSSQVSRVATAAQQATLADILTLPRDVRVQGSSPGPPEVTLLSKGVKKSG